MNEYLGIVTIILIGNVTHMVYNNERAFSATIKAKDTASHSALRRIASITVKE